MHGQVENYLNLYVPVAFCVTIPSPIHFSPPVSHYKQLGGPSLSINSGLRTASARRPRTQHTSPASPRSRAQRQLGQRSRLLYNEDLLSFIQ